MKQFHHLAALATVAIAAAGAAAPRAQADVIPIRAKIGVFLPQGGSKDIAGSTNFTGEVEARIPNLGQGKYAITAGYSQGTHSGGKLRMIPLTVSRVFAPPNPVGKLTGNPYFGVGVGAYFLRANVSGGASDSATRIGGFGQVGYQFPNPYFVEAKYHLTGKVAGKTVSGLAVMVGRHF